MNDKIYLDWETLGMSYGPLTQTIGSIYKCCTSKQNLIEYTAFTAITAVT